MAIRIEPIKGISGPCLLEPDVFGDQRGYFKETFRASLLEKLGVEAFVQDNESRSAKHVLRGLHYQLEPHGQAKLIRCIRGAIFDVVVDMRQGGPTYGQWAGYELSEENHRMFFVPVGFAHGFLGLRDDTVVQYKQTQYYAPQVERAVLWSDPEIGISWPVDEPMVSEKDRLAPPLRGAENNFRWSE